MILSITGKAAYVGIVAPRNVQTEADKPARFCKNMGIVFSSGENECVLKEFRKVFEETLGKDGTVAYMTAWKQLKLTQEAMIKFPKRAASHDAYAGGAYALSLNSRSYATEAEAQANTMMYTPPGGVPVPAIFEKDAVSGKLRVMRDPERIRPGADVRVQCDFWLNKKQGNKPIFTLTGVVFLGQPDVWESERSYDAGGEDIAIDAEPQETNFV
jgi:hypothetical protein